MSALILTTMFSVQHPIGKLQCELATNGTGCVPVEGPFYFDNVRFTSKHPVIKDCCRFLVSDFPVISGNENEQRFSELRLRQSSGHNTAINYAKGLNFECYRGSCSFYTPKTPAQNSSDLITFTLIIVFFCCWVQWSLHLTDHIKECLAPQNSQYRFIEPSLIDKTAEKSDHVPDKLAHYDKILKSFSIVVLDVIWYVAWDKIDTLSSTPDFYDDEFENLMGTYNVQMYCRGIQNATLLLALYLTVIILSKQDLLSIKPASTPAQHIKVLLKTFVNGLFRVCAFFFGNRSGKPRVQLSVRWLLEVLLLNAVYISVPWRLGYGIRRIVGFGAGCTIAFITGRDGFMLQNRFELTAKQQLAVFFIIIVIVGHAAIFMLFPLFATSMTLLGRHALVISLSLATQIASVGKLFS